MKTALPYIVAFVLIGNLYSQTDSNFQDLVKVFNQGKDSEIPSALAQKYFDFTPNTDPDWGNKELRVKEIVFKNEKFIGLSAYSDCGAGGICEHTDLIIFTNSGAIVDKVSGFETDAADCSFEDIKYCTYYSDTLLILVNQETEGDCIEDTLFKNKIQIENLYILENGKIKQGQSRKIDTRRKYYITSIKRLYPKDLINTSKEDLAIMRNEIFAAHGYKFKSNKWLDYFSAEDWYVPRFDNVDNQLSVIERKNIEIIIKFENR